MNLFFRKIRFVGICVFLLGCPLTVFVCGQQVNRPGASRKEKPNRPGQRIAARPIPAAPKVERKKGDFLLYTTPTIPNVEVALNRSDRNQAGAEAKTVNALTNDKGYVHLKNLPHGKYVVTVSHADYKPFQKSIVISRRISDPLPVEMVSRFGDVILSFSQQSGLPGRDVRVLLGEELLALENLSYGKTEIVIPRVPVGGHQIQVVKSGYDNWRESEFKVEPGKNVLAVDLKPATISLKVETLAGASLYHINEAKIPESKGVIPPNGELLISGLLPGRYTWRVFKDGYEIAEKNILLTLDKRNDVVSIELQRQAETSGGTENFDPEINNWYPKRSTQLLIDEGRGMLVRGEQPTLFAGPRKEGHSFGYYDDFTLVIQLKLNQDTAASWIVRALDENNYYRFDLTPDNRIVFSICSNGQRGNACEKIDSSDVIIDRGQPDDVLTIQLRAEGNRFRHLFAQTSRPQEGMSELGVRVFINDRLKVGGVGLCAAGGKAFYLSQFSIIVKKQ